MRFLRRLHVTIMICVFLLLSCDTGMWLEKVEVSRSIGIPFEINSVMDCGDFGSDIYMMNSASYSDSLLLVVIESPEEINDVCGWVEYSSDSIPTLESLFPENGVLVIASNILWYEDEFQGYSYSYEDSTFSVVLDLGYAQNVENPIAAAYNHILIFAVE